MGLFQCLRTCLHKEYDGDRRKEFYNSLNGEAIIDFNWKILLLSHLAYIYHFSNLFYRWILTQYKHTQKMKFGIDFMQQQSPLD